MPSLEHEALVDMFREQPTLIVDLLRTLKIEIPPHATITIADASLGEVKPTTIAADLVIELCDAAGRPVLAIVLEVQLQPDDAKGDAWPNYLTTHRRRRRCPTCVLVLTPSREVAAWARRPIFLGPGNPEFRVLVLGPDEVPVITDPVDAVANPTLAFLSALTHGDDADGFKVVQTALDALARVDSATARLYIHLVQKALSEPRRRLLEARTMLNINYDEIPESNLPQYVAIVSRQVKDILRILEIRKIPITPEQRRAFKNWPSYEQLDRWLDRAVTASSVEEVLREDDVSAG